MAANTRATAASPAAPADARDSKARILDEAERLFAQHGFDGVSLRQITKAAGAQLSMANYHFGSKADLFVQVIHRRADDLNRGRLAAISDLEKLPPDRSIPLKAVAEAFIRPALELSRTGGPGWRNYARLIAQIYNAPDWIHLGMKEFDPVAHRYIALLRRALPDSPEEDIYWGYHFLLGAMLITFAETGRIDQLSGGRYKSSSVERIYERMIPFVAGGFQRLAGDAPGPAAPPAAGRRVRRR